MISSPFIADPGRLPKAADLDRAARGVERWLETAARLDDGELAAFARTWAEDPAGRQFLDALLGNSPFLGNALVAEMAFAREFLETGPDAAFAGLLSGLTERLAGETSETNDAVIMAALRRTKRRAALLIAAADIAGLWTLEAVTGALSDFAERALGLALAYLLRRAADQGQIALADRAAPETGCGYFVLALGKLGGRELNYSSDIDLVVLYDEDKAPYTGKKSARDFFPRLTRDLVRLLQERTEDGYVFRTDLRLRPDPGSTPLAISVHAAESYYEGTGQNWERAAMIKARNVAGDAVAAAAFIERLRPFLWRRNLDFAAIEDIHSIKRQIDTYRGHKDIKTGGQNIKLGPGGIREIEFFAQTQQLIRGGRDPELRVSATCEALAVLCEKGHITAQTRDGLVAAYAFLRRVEHRLQMVDDRQTHTIPEETQSWHALATFLGYDEAQQFESELHAHLTFVSTLYGELFSESPALGGPGNLVFTGGEDDPATLATLEEMGFRDGANIAGVVRNWHRGRYPAIRSERARQLLTELMPAILSALADTADPDLAFMKFNEFLSRLPAGVQLFSLFQANPGLLGLMAEIMGNAPRLADRLSRRPILLDGVLAADFFDPLPDAETLKKEAERALELATDFEGVLNTTRRWSKDRKFQLGVQMLRNRTDAEATATSFSDIGDILFNLLQPRVEEAFAEQYGAIPGAGMAVIAMGKLGSREMTVASDVDMIFVYSDTPDDAVSTGAKPLMPAVYFSRMAQRLINALTAPTAEGELYEVDMRLRPSGASGPIACSLDAFRKYQSDSAWVWEHMALTRARAVTGEESLRNQIGEAIRDVLTQPRDPGTLAAEVADMRRRIADSFPGTSPWDIKYTPGGMIDVEFITQYLQLRHAHDHPHILSPNTVTALGNMAREGLLESGEAEDLMAAARFWHRLQGLLRLCFKETPTTEGMSRGLRTALSFAGGAVDFDALTTKMESTAARVGDLYEAIIGAPGRDQPLTKEIPNP
ncbi:MAG: bifunctional [glutamine synthetase] adenylyltransferase/[glutamine synthetase]-adenylyl-L-tyrosine phosphorylase [Alphaproteobacteria bacterium]|nr:bifunctional [glutamine synthetase] adenylyltransferase/[glutamine synthetase]-adenylyl-L-tyrosine phosphorylase [Alphaproteobacteria bacterium]